MICKRKNDKPGFNKIKTIVFANIIKKMKRQARNGRKYLQIIPDTGLIPKIEHKEFIQLNSKKKPNQKTV